MKLCLSKMLLFYMYSSGLVENGSSSCFFVVPLDFPFFYVSPVTVFIIMHCVAGQAGPNSRTQREKD